MPCAAGVNPLQLEHTEVYITSSTLDLIPFGEATVEITGTLVPGPCTLVDAQVIAAAPYILETCGGALGCGARINLLSQGAGQFGLFVSLDTGFFPISTVSGSSLIDPTTSVLLLVGPEPTGGFFQIDVTIPADAAIIATTVRLQALRVPAGGAGALQASTVDTIFTGTFSTPCHVPGC